jgi:hypothetical protein
MARFLSRVTRRPLSAAAAEELLAGRGAAPGAPAGQHALARVLEVAAGPPTDRELADEAAYVATFVLATSRVGARRAALSHVLRLFAQLTVTVAAAAIVVGATAAYTGQLPGRLQEMAHAALGAPAPHHASPSSPLPAGARLPPGRTRDPQSVRAGLPVRDTPTASTTAPPGKAAAARPSPPAQTDVYPKILPAGPHPEIRDAP